MKGILPSFSAFTHCFHDREQRLNSILISHLLTVCGLDCLVLELEKFQHLSHTIDLYLISSVVQEKSCP